MCSGNSINIVLFVFLFEEEKFDKSIQFLAHMSNIRIIQQVVDKSHFFVINLDDVSNYDNIYFFVEIKNIINKINF